VREEADTLLLSTVGRGESLPANGEERGGINRCLQKKGARGAARAAHRRKEEGTAAVTRTSTTANADLKRWLKAAADSGRQ
jgi:hypothetical protein